MTEPGSPDFECRSNGVSGTKVLFSEGASSSARQTLYSLGGKYFIGIADPDRICQCRFSRFAGAFHRCPSFSAKPLEYLEFLVHTIRSGRYAVLLPTHEQVYLFSRFQDQLARRVGLAVPNFAAVRRVQSKSDFVRLLDEVGLPQPPARIVGSLDEAGQTFEYPCYVKLPHSTAGTGVRLVTGPEAMRRTADELRRSGKLENVSEIVIQQPATGVQSLVQSIFQRGRLVAAHTTEAIQVGIGGGQIFRHSAAHPGVVEDLRRLGEHLEWHGALFLEYFYDPANASVQYFEANPRIGEAYNATLSGLNLADLLVRISLGEDVRGVPSPQLGVRSHVGFMLLLAEALRGGGRARLLRHLWQIHTGRGMYTGAENEITRPADDWGSLIPELAVALELLLKPGQARSIVDRTVNNYSLSDAGARLVEQLDHGEVSARIGCEPSLRGRR